MKLARTLLSFLLVATCTLILPSAHATDQYEANWRLSNSGIPEPFFTMWPSRMAGGGAFSGVFPACTSSDPSDCIKSVEYQDSQSNWISGKLESYFPVDEDYETLPGKTNYKFTDNAYSTNPVKDSILPKSARSSIWTFPGIEHSGGSKFLVSVTVFRGGNDVAIANSTAQSQLSIVPFSDSIQSITKEELNGVMPFLALLQAPDLETICYLDAIS